MSEVLEVYRKYVAALKAIPSTPGVVDPHLGIPIEDEIARVEKHIERITPKPPEQCPDCKLMNNDPRCCQNDEELWK
jgi:hypothetical protein